MTKIKQLLAHLATVASNADTAHNLRGPNFHTAGLTGPAQITCKGGKTHINLEMRHDKLSNHAKLEAIAAIDRLKSALKDTMSDLREIFDDRDISYYYDAQSKKHNLTLDHQSVLDAVISTWRQQIPVIQKVFHSEGPQTIWLIDRHCNATTTLYRKPEVIIAPSLAAAYIQRQFTEMTLSERKGREAPSGTIFAAAKLSSAGNATMASNKKFDADVAEAAWDRFKSQIEGLPIPSCSDLRVAVEAGPDIETNLTQDVSLHPLIHPDERNHFHAEQSKIVEHFEEFVSNLKEIAPNTTFSLSVDMFMGRACVPKISVGTTKTSNTREAVDALRASEETGHAPQRLFAVLSEQQVNLVKARTGDEAIANAPKFGNMKTTPSTSTVAYFVEPVSLDFIKSQMDGVEKEWQDRTTRK